MSAMTTTRSLEALSRCIRAARNTQHSHTDNFTEGLVAGLDIALRAVESELQLARDIEAAQAPHQ
ncbi:hypothetical protein [Massilia sp. CT11-137]|uniref:hypothetical protein n=1 Tax=Massilia sp. CT11-137 TaxID=3393901 RepID=UPI0039B02FF3